jgi:hypothetical protein
LTATAYQTLHGALEERETAREAVGQARAKPAIIDTCLALSSSGEVVRKRWPAFYRNPAIGETET